MPRITCPSRGDIIWLDFDPQLGHEQAGRRPALVLSHREYNLATGMAIVCPMTSKVENAWPFTVVIGPGSYYTSLMPIFLVRGVREALAEVKGPIVLVANLLTEGYGMRGFTAGEAARRLGAVIGRRIDAVVVNTGRPDTEVLVRYAAEHKEPLEVGDLPEGCGLVLGEFWTRGIARHDRRRLAYAIWSALSTRLLEE